MAETYRLEQLRPYFAGGGVIYAVLSDMRDKQSRWRRAEIRPVQIGGALRYQAALYDAKQVQHQNLDDAEILTFLETYLGPCFKQAQIYAHDADLHIRFSKRGDGRVLRKAPSRRGADTLSHNRHKRYILPEGVPCAFLEALSIMDAQGHVYKKKYDKFKQINRYLEFIRDVVEVLPERPVIVDFGCGKAYLTFALYYYLVTLKGMDAQIVGLDLKSEVIAHCNQVSDQLGFSRLHFEQGRIESYTGLSGADMVISLHACDTATDAALIQAVEWGARVIMAVPCCHHELFGQLKSSEMAPMLEHGVVKDKLATLVTDTLRAKALEGSGYTVQMLEFIDMTHTPKNIMIRAVLEEPSASQRASMSRGAYRDFKRVWQVTPAIDALTRRW